MSPVTLEKSLNLWSSFFNNFEGVWPDHQKVILSYESKFLWYKVVL